ncbi:glutamyl-tRNA reductase [Luteolibacter arcticus]|uniref:Glutamyl-tRNA reductase n=1 Tax=Luteolibacter arcticus TaxID=1581411 RepID=A0ABT3GLK8_9BACT|nr:glutamyl-tRNA reductase [Luteolibacter arcticus]MCW1924365.1 glutamyl-tRNA reductase [Luteolibacter arcticus]
MELVCVGLNHRTAPVEVRERFAVSASKLGDSAKDLLTLDGLAESVVLSTCNRTEFYLAGEKAEEAAAELRRKLEQSYGKDSDPHWYEYHRISAARHLCRVVSGLDSMVLGETEIFGQTKEAYRQALESGATSATLNKLFQRAFAVGKKVRTDTRIQEGATSVAGAAVELAEKIFGKLAGCRVIVIGAGDMSRQTAQALVSRGASSVFVTNRSFDKAEQLATEMGGRAVRFDEWQAVLAGVDVVISSTSAPHPVVLPHHIESVRRVRKFRPLFLIDIAVPRDIDPACGEIEEVYLYDIDTLEQLADEARVRREKQIVECDRIIDEELRKLNLPGT